MEVPPNIEAEQILSPSPAFLSHSSNPALIKENPEFLLYSGCWQPLCRYDCMILVIIRMKVLTAKRMELSQTIASLIGSIRSEKGCERCDFCQNMENENGFYLFEEWDSQGNLMSHLESGRFRVLRGAMTLLQEPYEISFHRVFQPGEVEEV